MSVKYAKRFEEMFLCYHPKSSKMTVKTAAKYLRKSPQFVDNDSYDNIFKTETVTVQSYRTDEGHHQHLDFAPHEHTLDQHTVGNAGYPGRDWPIVASSPSPAIGQAPVVRSFVSLVSLPFRTFENFRNQKERRATC
ncbi:hypothetical protein K0M31_012651 [Melipona bicolor]|uniref:Uncharacterized protein n=1 Tax=Melipona bicolor TaxID=60889 RepID=A0AA40KHI3_9HYME|nr:hypothetical protein K0M31_012651 [Melipona bicolor]